MRIYATLLAVVGFLLALLALIALATRQHTDVIIPASDVFHSMKGHSGLPHAFRCLLGFVALPGASWRERFISWGATAMGWLMVLAVAAAIVGMYVAGIASFFMVGPVLKSGVLLTVTGSSYKEIIAKAQEALDAQRCMKHAQRRGLDPYDSHATSRVCFERLFRDRARKR